MLNLKDVAVVIPTFNRAQVVSDAVQRYLGTGAFGDVVVVDDASSDQTVQKLSKLEDKHPRMHLLRHERNRGAGAARNTGLRYVINDLSFSGAILVTDDDIIFNGLGEVEYLYRLLKDNRHIDIVSPILVGGRPSQIESLPRKRNFADEISELPRAVGFNKETLELKTNEEIVQEAPGEAFVNTLSTGVMLLTSEVASVVQYDEELGTSSYRDETDFQLRAWKAGYILVSVASFVLRNRRTVSMGGGCHSGGLVEYEQSAIRNNWELLKKNEMVVERISGLSIQMMQAQFIWERLALKLPKRVIVRVRNELS